MEDAVQVCLQHVQSLNQAPKHEDRLPDDKSDFFRRLLAQRGEDSAVSDLESGNRNMPISNNTDPQQEPLLSRKS